MAVWSVGRTAGRPERRRSRALRRRSACRVIQPEDTRPRWPAGTRAFVVSAQLDRRGPRPGLTRARCAAVVASAARLPANPGRRGRCRCRP